MKRMKKSTVGSVPVLGAPQALQVAIVDAPGSNVVALFGVVDSHPVRIELDAEESRQLGSLLTAAAYVAAGAMPPVLKSGEPPPAVIVPGGVQ